MNYIEILGYLAMFIIAGSFMLKDILKLRVVNTLGATFFVIYGFLKDSIPVAGLNLFVVLVNLYYIAKIIRYRRKK